MQVKIRVHKTAGSSKGKNDFGILSAVSTSWNCPSDLSQLCIGVDMEDVTRDKGS